MNISHKPYSHKPYSHKPYRRTRYTYSPLFPNTQSGGGSAWMQNFYANQVIGGNRAISRATLSVINQTPMFRPLQSKTLIPGPNGIIPTGLYLAGYIDPVNTDASPVPPDTVSIRGPGR